MKSFICDCLDLESGGNFDALFFCKHACSPILAVELWDKKPFLGPKVFKSNPIIEKTNSKLGKMNLVQTITKDIIGLTKVFSVRKFCLLLYNTYTNEKFWYHFYNL